MCKVKMFAQETLQRHWCESEIYRVYFGHNALALELMWRIHFPAACAALSGGIKSDKSDEHGARCIVGV